MPCILRCSDPDLSGESEALERVTQARSLVYDMTARLGCPSVATVRRLEGETFLEGGVVGVLK